MSGQLNARMRKSSVKTLVMSLVGHVLFALLVLGVLCVPLLLLTGCDQLKKENPYTGRQASLDTALEDHDGERDKLADDQAKADKAVQDAREKALAEARQLEEERQRKFQLEFAKLQREFAVERARTQADHETSLDTLAVDRDSDVSRIYAAAKVRADEDVAAIVAPITARVEAFKANELYLRDWERDDEERRATWLKALDVAKGVAGVVPGGGAAFPIIESLGTLLLGAGGTGVLMQRRSRKREDASWDEGYKTAKAEAAATREAADKAWDEADAKAKPDPTVALVTTLVSAIVGASKQAPSSPASPASKDAA